MPQFQPILLAKLLILTLLITACQQIISKHDLQPTKEPAANQEMIISPTSSPALIDTLMPLPTLTPTLTFPPTPAILSQGDQLPTRTSMPQPTPTSSGASQGDQLPARTPTLPPTPTTIPINEPVPATTNTPIPLPTITVLLNEVNLSTLNESLALLERLERRKEEPTSTPVGSIIYQGIASYVSTSNCYWERDLLVGLEGPVTFTAETFISGDGNVSGTLNTLSPKVISFTGTREFITGEEQEESFYTSCKVDTIYILQAKLTNNDQKFEGTVEITELSICGRCSHLWLLSLDRK